MGVAQRVIYARLKKIRADLQSNFILLVPGMSYWARELALSRERFKYENESLEL